MLIPIGDPRDPRLDGFRDLRHAAGPRSDELFVVEGRLLVERLLTASRFRPRSVLVAEAKADLLAPLVRRAGITGYVAPHAIIRAVAGFDFHRGALALAERGAPVRPGDLLAPCGSRTVVVLDRLADPANVGAVLRNAEAFAVDAALLAPGVADPLSRKSLRASAGAALRLPFATLAGWPDALAQLRDAGFTLVALSPAACRDIDLVAAEPPERLALLVGAEDAGLSNAARAFCHLDVRIPMAPGVDSLNVASATAIALHRLATRRTLARACR